LEVAESGLAQAALESKTHFTVAPFVALFKIKVLPVPVWAPDVHL
jgi:hypothetical protein